MPISLHTIVPTKGSKKKKKRLGRGLASRGAKSGRGQKGQKSRSGSSGFQRRGMRKLMLATPKLRGFKSPHGKASVINIKDIELYFEEGGIVSPKTLISKKLISSSKDGVKVLGVGDITKKVIVKKCSVSKTAAEKILKAGGTVEA